MAYSDDTELYYVKTLYSNYFRIMSKKEIQVWFRQGAFNDLEIYKIDMKRGNLIPNKQLASKSFLEELEKKENQI